MIDHLSLDMESAVSLELSGYFEGEPEIDFNTIDMENSHVVSTNTPI